MSHELEINPATGQASFMGTQSAWHRLGTVREEGFTAEEGMKVAGLSGWNVRKLPLYHLGDDPDAGEATEVEHYFVTVRDNPFAKGQIDTLGIVGDVYHPFQNEDAADFLNLFVGEAKAKLETLGSIRSGRQVFMSMRLPGYLDVAGTDRHDLYLTILTSHDGSLKITIMLTVVRVVCANTFDWALRSNVSMASLRHTNTAKARVEEVRQVLGVTYSAKDEFNAEAERMIQETMTKKAFERTMFGPTGVYSAIAPKVTAGQAAKNHWAATRDGLMDYFTGDVEKDKEGAVNIGGTHWGAFQAVTWMEDHKRNIRTAGDRDTARAERAVAGGIGANLKNKAWSALRIPVKGETVPVLA